MKAKDYLHLYIGCEYNLCNERIGKTFTGKLVGIAGDDVFVLIGMNVAKVPIKDENKLVLRKLSGMSHVEQDEFNEMVEFEKANCTHELPLLIECHSEQTKWLLSKGFDLFALIESGLAHDKNVFQLNKIL